MHPAVKRDADQQLFSEWEQGGKLAICSRWRGVVEGAGALLCDKSRMARARISEIESVNCCSAAR
jgi:hypothetical protein